MPRVVLIDDDSEALDEIGVEVSAALSETRDARVELWQPESDKGIEQLDELRDDTALVVTDLDLSIARSGIGGDTIVRWCQRNALPAALYTRRPADESAVPDLFELRLRRDLPRGPFVAELFRGFCEVRDSVSVIPLDEHAGALASVLAHVVGRPDLEYELAQYTTHLGEASGALTAIVQRTAPPDANPAAPSEMEKRRILAYVLGHVLLNAVIRYPGPLLTRGALCAYVGTTLGEADTLHGMFANALYHGPFNGVDQIYWRRDVESIIDKAIPKDAEYSDNIVRRRAVELYTNKKLERHACPRCEGMNGGFYCPFTQRAVCERSDCSTASNSWLPLGATACRIELEFFEEWAPLLRY